MQHDQLIRLAETALEDLKAIDIKILTVRHLSAFTDTMIVCSGTSKRHVQSLAANVVKTFKEIKQAPRGIEGSDAGEWVLVDLGDLIVHVMASDMREFYKLEELWTIPAAPLVEANE